MNVLIIGSGGREHALADAYSKSPKVKSVLVAPGNGYIDIKTKKAKCFPEIKPTDFDSILKLVKRNKIDLVDVASDDPLAEGFVDRLGELDIKAFGPTKLAAEIEWSKEWSRNFMKKYKLPTPDFEVFADVKKAIQFINKSKEDKFFVKASGLALGKGAIRADSKKDAIDAVGSMKNFGKSGETFLIEELIYGEEFSLFSICDGVDFQIIGTAQDHKTVYNNGQGPNTGGMGCISSPDFITPKILKEIEVKILIPFMKGMIKEGRPYTGILYLGGMITDKGIKIIEFNSRWGDPEAEVLIPAISNDYLTLIESSISGKIKKIKIKKDNLKRISIAGCSSGYPTDYSKVKGKKVLGLNGVSLLPGIEIFGAGIARVGKNFTANGGRVFHLLAEGRTVTQSRIRGYGAMALISIEGNNLHYRTDIGIKEMERHD